VSGHLVNEKKTRSVLPPHTSHEQYRIIIIIKRRTWLLVSFVVVGAESKVGTELISRVFEAFGIPVAF